MIICLCFGMLIEWLFTPNFVNTSQRDFQFERFSSFQLPYSVKVVIYSLKLKAKVLELGLGILSPYLILWGSL